MEAAHVMILFVVIFFDAQISYSQRNDSTKTVYETTPIIRHADKSPFPDTIHVVGYLDDYPSRGMCGVYCMGGAIKVRLQENIPGYNHHHIYLVTACLGERPSKGSKVNVTASKLKKEDKECYYSSVTNPFDSKGLPFYKLTEAETKKIQ